MDIAHIGHVAVSGVQATTVSSTEIPAGMIGGYITFEFDPSWDGFTRHVTIEGSGAKTTLGVSDRVSVDKALIEYPNVRVKVGITGVSEDGSQVIPTMWAELGTTRPGAPTDLSGGTSDGGQESPIWAQIIGMIGDLNALETEDRGNLVAAVNEVTRNGGGGAGGYYTPIVTQPTEGTMQIAFTPSVATMPAVEPVTINLPGSNSGQNPDWNQNDPDAPDYVKNRTHWEESTRAVIEWDGNTEGLESAELAGTTYYKIHDATPSLDELKGALFEGFMNGVYGTYTATEEEYNAVVELNAQYCVNCIFVGNPCIIAYDTTANLVGQDVEFSSTGVWIHKDYRKITYGSTTVHTLDEKFIPDTIARKITNEITLVSPSGTPFDITVSDDGVLSVNGTPISGGEVLTDAEGVAF